MVVNQGSIKWTDSVKYIFEVGFSSYGLVYGLQGEIEWACNSRYCSNIPPSGGGQWQSIMAYHSLAMRSVS